MKSLKFSLQNKALRLISSCHYIWIMSLINLKNFYCYSITEGILRVHTECCNNQYKLFKLLVFFIAHMVI